MSDKKNSTRILLCEDDENLGLLLCEYFGIFAHEAPNVGRRVIKNNMDRMRKNPPKELAGLKVLEVRDYKEHTIVDINGNERETDLPTSNVLYYELENNSWCCVRPSGTEPKIKFYMGVKGSTKDDANVKLDELTNAMKSFVE